VKVPATTVNRSDCGTRAADVHSIEVFISLFWVMVARNFEPMVSGFLRSSSAGYSKRYQLNTAAGIDPSATSGRCLTSTESQ